MTTTNSVPEQTELVPDRGEGTQPGTGHASKAPICLIPGGRGNRGKTHTARWVAETAFNAGRPLILADGDRTNQTLSGFFPDVTTSPRSAQAAAVHTWLEDTIETAAAEGSSLIFDTGAGDQTMMALAQELDIVDTITQAGLTPVALYCLSADSDDLSAILSSRKSFAPAATIIAFNTFNLPPHLNPADTLMELGERDPRLGELLENGGELVMIPSLTCTFKLTQRRLRFDDAESGHGTDPLSIFDRQRIAMWRRSMTEAFQPVSMWLP